MKVTGRISLAVRCRRQILCQDPVAISDLCASECIEFWGNPVCGSAIRCPPRSVCLVLRANAPQMACPPANDGARTDPASFCCQTTRGCCRQLQNSCVLSHGTVRRQHLSVVPECNKRLDIASTIPQKRSRHLHRIQREIAD